MSNRAKKTKKNYLIPIIVILVLAIIAIFAVILFTAQEEVSATYAPVLEVDTKLAETIDRLDISHLNGWPLNYINPDYPMQSDANIELALAPGDEYVDARILEPLLSMFSAGADAGLVMYVNSGYRSVEHQRTLYNNRVDSYIAAGYSEEAAIAQTNRWVAPPGTSEHALGIAVDITADEITTTDWQVYTWLADNAHNFGFTLSFPADRVSETGVGYEPWHYRYVGVAAAVYMYENNLLLHEYLDIFY